MADAPAAQKPSSFGFLTRKIGPVPIWLIGVAGFGAYWWWKHRRGGRAQAAPRPQIIEVPGQRGPRGPRGYRGPGDRDIDRRPWEPRERPGYAAAARGPAPAVAQPTVAAAPMTGADVYGNVPVATANGSTYDSGDVAGTMGDPYAVAG